MLGQRIPHPASTNFDEFETPTPKRLKRLDSLDSSLARDKDEGDDETRDKDYDPREIADSEAESDEDEDNAAPTPARRTNLESALPPVATDKEAIEEYEATKANELEEKGELQQRVDDGKWVRGRSSIYVDALNLALETVLEEESHLFDEAENEVFTQWRRLNYEAQYLYVRLFLRKSAAWHRVNRLRYHGDIGNLQAASEELLQARVLPIPEATEYDNPGEDEAPTNAILGSTFSFADSSTAHITTLEEASGLLLLDELKDIAKDAKVQGKNKGELLKALRQTSGRQSGIGGWRGLKRSETEESIKSEASESEGLEDYGTNRDGHFVRKILRNTGQCIRLSSAPFKLFERVLLVFYRSTEWTERSLTTIILAKISRRNFPEYIVSRSTNIFPSRSMLLEFEAAVRTQFRVDTILESNGTVTIDGLKKVENIAADVYPRWKTLLIEEQQKEERVYDSGEGAYLRRFSPAWVYTRIIHKGLPSLARFKEHTREYELLKELLGQRLFHAARRGAWYQRKALLEEHYMWDLHDNEGRSNDAQKRYWRQMALRTCEQGLEDRECHLIYHYDLQKRISKLERALKVPKRQQHDFAHVLLAKPAERTFTGIRIEKPARTASLRKSRRSSSTPPRGRTGGGKTIWVDEREGGGECNVEAMCLSNYRDLGYKGYHTEGRLVRTLFGILFYDVLFEYVPNVFQTAFQTCPLDLHTDAFYPARFSEIAHQLARLSNGDAMAIFRDVWDRLFERQVCVVGVDWTFAKEDLEEILECFPGDALAVVCKVMAQEYQQRGGGIPDLFLWHPEKKAILFAEVKSENDRLSDTQRLWIHVLAGAGVGVELCNAVAGEVRNVED
jgi:Fanconi-associated nuclease 1